jgi:hypothetical protein
MRGITRPPPDRCSTMCRDAPPGSILPGYWAQKHKLLQCASLRDLGALEARTLLARSVLQRRDGGHEGSRQVPIVHISRN